MSSFIHHLLSFISNILLVYLLYMVCRVVYVMEFWDLYSAGWDALSLGSLVRGGLRFDTSAIVYTNLLYALLVLAPWPLKWRRLRGWQVFVKTVFVVVNAVMLSINLVDTVYSRYTGRRTTWTFFSEFSNENNLGSIVGVELVNHWYLVLIGLAFIAALIWLYRDSERIKNENEIPSVAKYEIRKTFGYEKRKTKNGSAQFSILNSQFKRLPPPPVTSHQSPVTNHNFQFSILSILSLLVYVPLAIIGMRGGASTAIRPITISNANQYVNQPSEAAIVLNTPFCLIRTMGKTTFADPGYFSAEELDEVYSPVHFINENERPSVTKNEERRTAPPNSQFSILNSQLKKNVVVLIVESFAKEYIGAYNDYAGDTPFLDSLISESLTFRYSYANGRKSIDGMPSILSGIPMFVEPFFVTSYSLNNVSGIAGELSKAGYTTAFFHGADNGSMGFQAFARTTGFQHYYGRTEYEAAHTDGTSDFDGTWAIWDEEFLQYYADQMSAMPQPFMTALFTATSHHPFVVPERYRETLHQPGHPIHTCVRYTDQALRRFFAKARTMPWYKNTLFVITADHTNINEQPAYNTALGTYSVPIIFYDPSADMPKGMSDIVAQQTDIMPTVLTYLGYGNPYVAFGKDLLHTSAEDGWAIHYNNGVYQYVRHGWLLLYDGTRVLGLYNIVSDPMLRHNLSDKTDYKSLITDYLRHTQGIIQSYMTRMINNEL